MTVYQNSHWRYIY